MAELPKELVNYQFPDNDGLVGVRLAIVEDDRAIADLARGVAEDEGAEVVGTRASTVAEALNLIDQGGFNVLFLDREFAVGVGAPQPGEAPSASYLLIESLVADATKRQVDAGKDPKTVKIAGGDIVTEYIVRRYFGHFAVVAVTGSVGDVTLPLKTGDPLFDATSERIPKPFDKGQPQTAIGRVALALELYNKDKP